MLLGGGAPAAAVTVVGMSDDLKRKFGNRVKKLREAQAITQEQLAERIGRSVETIGSIERGVNGTRIETAQQLADALDVRLPELFHLDEILTSLPDAREKAMDTLTALLAEADAGTIEQIAALVRVGLDLTRKT